MSYLTEKERYQIETLLREKKTVAYIARFLGRHYNTVYHEIRRGAVVLLDTHLKEKVVYDAFRGQSVRTENGHHKGRPLNIGSDVKLAEFLEAKVLDEKMSPYAAQCSARSSGLVVPFCLKTFYNYIHGGVFLKLDGKQLQPHAVKADVEKRLARNHLFGRSIDDRPRSVGKREEVGHWEMDTVQSGQGDSSCLLVLSERVSRREIIRKMPDKCSSSVVAVLDELERADPFRFSRVFKSITVDNGCEFMDVSGIETSCLSGSARTVLYYCHPYCSSERGTNENQNRLIRRWCPKGCHFSEYSAADIQRLEDWMNRYPRKLFHGRCADEIWNERMNC